ncbi:hypothetical protein SCHPADRAFT_941032 [Schizopora paradoxa]|uniref:Uncharacterized protein n=1 Tax=Schizopora paradoxa TaxID=27342 RepID=A0A0H2RT86_9AGAM|nr:hypothetical protein SCHPADRAFT_941032 [Schizopora paradoxa]
MPTPQSKRTRFVGVGYIIALVLIGMGLMLAHHFFYAYLNEKPINSGSIGLPPFLKNQNNASFIGTAIAHGARIAFSMAIGVTFAQLFWDTLRKRAHTIEQIDALVRCGKSPFNPSALQAATASFAIFLTSFIATAMALVVIITPGSLTIASDVSSTRSCEVQTLPTAVDSNCSSIGITLGAASLNVLASNTYMSPLLLDRDTACGAGASTCSYNVSFHGPAFDCVDITNQTDFSQFLNSTEPPPPDGAPFVMWNVSSTEGVVLGLEILTQDLVKGAVQATNCTAYNATYQATVNSEEASTTVQVWNVSLHSALMSLDEMPFMSTLAISAMDNIMGLIYAGPNGFLAGADDDPIQTSPLFGTTATGNHTFTDDIIHFHTSYMQNVSISLLSGNVYYCLSNDTSTNLQNITTTCSSTFSIYIYDSSRLLITYGVALGVAAMLAVIGGWLVLKHGREEKLLFSQVVRLALNEELFRVAKALEKRTPLLLDRFVGDNPSWRFVPVPSLNADIDSEQYEYSSSEAEKFAAQGLIVSNSTIWNRSWRRFANAKGRSVILVLSTLIFMVLHHAYYHYLDGKPPSSRLRTQDSQWLRDQTVVSDVGLALAYAGQSLLIAAIAISLTQRFWRTLRSRALNIAELDALMSMQTSSLSTSTIRAARTSPGVLFLALLAASMTLITIFAPGAIKVSSNHGQSRQCTIMVPKNLSAVATTGDLASVKTIYEAPIMVAMSSGTYLPPMDPCELDGAAQCSYDLQFFGPGFQCSNVTASSNEPAFITPDPSTGTINLFGASIKPQDENLTMSIFVETWDSKNSVFQATSCEGVLQFYSVVVAHTNTTSSIDVVESRAINALHANTSQLSFFTDVYVFDIISALQGVVIARESSDSAVLDLVSATNAMGNMATFELDGNITWNRDMPSALEEFVQNAALGVLSGQVVAFNPDDPSLLENSTTTCTYSFPAYEYSPSVLFLTYGIAVFLTILSSLWGALAIRLNGVEESMDFSRFLRAILNAKLYYVQERLDSETKLKAENSVTGELIPFLS